MPVLNWETIESPIGTLVLFGTKAGIARISWDCDDPQGAADADLGRVGAKSAERGWNALLEEARDQLKAWFDGDRKEFDLPLSPDPRSGNAFSARVLAETAAIPRGQTLTYGEVAAAAGNPAGARAAGNALGANTIPVIVPCHRVVAANGLGGFGGGSERKLTLLAIEAN